MISEYAINLLIQIPLVGIFVIFTLKIIERQDTENQRRDEQWREFLKEQTERHNTGLSRIAEEVKGNTTVLIQLKEKVGIVHDK